MFLSPLVEVVSGTGLNLNVLEAVLFSYPNADAPIIMLYLPFESPPLIVQEYVALPVSSVVPSNFLNNPPDGSVILPNTDAPAIGAVEFLSEILTAKVCLSPG